MRIQVMCGLAAFLVMADMTAAQPPRFRFTDLGVLTGGTQSYAYRINDHGQIVGQSNVTDSPYMHAVTWIDGRIVDLTGLGVSGAQANAVNVHGQVVGMSDALGLNAFVWDSGPVEPLPFPHSCCSEALGINAGGLIVGRASLAGISTPTDGVLWAGGRIIPLGHLGGDFAVGYDINDAGVVVGSSLGDDGNYHGFTWLNGRMTPLPDLGGFFNEAVAISENGLIVGNAAAPGFTRAVLWQDGKVEPLPALGGFASYATDVNDAGWIVGYSYISGFTTSHAVLWIDGEAHDLNPLNVNAQGAIAVNAYGINNAGAIVGVASTPAGVRGFKLTPVAPADLDADGAVNTLDLGILLGSWTIPPSTGCAEPCPADINADGVVNTLDLGILLAGWTM